MAGALDKQVVALGSAGVRRHAAARVAWALTAVAAVAVVADTAVVATYENLLSEESVAVHGFPLVSAAVVGSAAMGALIVARFPRHPIGWLLNVVGVTSAVALFAEGVSNWTVNEGGPGPRELGGVAGWLSMLLGGQLSLALIAVMFMLAPEGRFLSPGWRRFALVPLLGALACTASVLMVRPVAVDLRDRQLDGPPVQATWAGGLLLILVGLLGAVLAMAVRLRRSDGVQRQQLRVMALSVILLAVGFVLLAVVQAVNGGRQTWAAGMPLFVAYFLLPVLFAVAVLRLRLYDIEVFLNRTLVLALATAFVGVGYTALVVGAGRVVTTRTGDFWLSVAATALVALAFQPARHAVVRFANRLAFGRRAQPYEALASFGRQLSSVPSAPELFATVAEAAGRAVAAVGATAVLEVDGAEPVSATWHAGRSRPSTGYSFPVAEADARLGRVEVQLPLGRPLTEVDERLLRDVADQAAVAFRNVALELRLAREVERLAEVTRELTESRRRIVAAEDAARRGLEAALSRQVLPRLSVMPDRLRALAAAPLTPSGVAEVERLADDATGTVEALREITRGVYPAVLARSGLAAALRARIGGSGRLAAVHVDPGAEGRFPQRAETAAYVMCLEAGAVTRSPAEVRLSCGPDQLVVRITGAGLDASTRLAGADRVDAAGGTVEAAEGTVVVRLPVTPDPAP